MLPPAIYEEQDFRSSPLDSQRVPFVIAEPIAPRENLKRENQRLRAYFLAHQMFQCPQVYLTFLSPSEKNSWSSSSPFISIKRIRSFGWPSALVSNKTEESSSVRNLHSMVSTWLATGSGRRKTSESSPGRNSLDVEKEVIDGSSAHFGPSKGVFEQSHLKDWWPGSQRPWLWHGLEAHWSADEAVDGQPREIPVKRKV